MSQKPLMATHSDLRSRRTDPSQIYDVVIVGAGPVGLATAIGLRERGIENILVIDQTRAFRQVGQVIDVLPNGLKALKHLSVQAYEGLTRFNTLPSPTQSSKATKPIGEETTVKKPNPQWVHRTVSGESIRSVPMSSEHWIQQYGEGRISTSWFGLQTKLREYLPSERVRIDRRCIGLREDLTNGVIYVECCSNSGTSANPYAHWEEQSEIEDHVTKYGQEAPPSVESKLEPETIAIPTRLVIGADGINSTIRRVLYQSGLYSAHAQPQYSGFSAIYCMEIQDVPEALHTELNRLFFQDATVVTVCGVEVSRESLVDAAPRIMMFHRPSGHWGYLIHAAIPRDQLKGKSGPILIQEAQRLLANANFPEVIGQYVGLAPEEKIQQRPYFIHKVTSDAPWSKGRTVLAGDAAHGMPPFVAQGVNQGLEDAATLSHLIAELTQQSNLDSAKAITEAFRDYEHLRRPIVTLVQNAVLAKTILWSEQEWQDYAQTVYGRNPLNFDR